MVENTEVIASSSDAELLIRIYKRLDTHNKDIIFHILVRTLIHQHVEELYPTGPIDLEKAICDRIDELAMSSMPDGKVKSLLVATAECSGRDMREMYFENGLEILLLTSEETISENAGQLSTRCEHWLMLYPHLSFGLKSASTYGAGFAPEGALGFQVTEFLSSWRQSFMKSVTGLLFR